jgi:uncharacterized protein (DUF1778 family)
MTASKPALSVRITAIERDLLVLAAKDAHTSLSGFVRRKALEAAEIDVLGARPVTIPTVDWERSEAWASAPAKDVRALRELSAHRPAWLG